MGTIEKIIFPHVLHDERNSGKRDTVIFFGTDYYNLPAGSNRGLFIERTNAMLRYIKGKFPGYRLLYQPHPNETDEYTFLKLDGFEVGEKTIADVLMWNHASRIAAVFASCSWSAASAYMMGFRAGVFLDLLRGAIPDDTLLSYRSYFAGFPDSFFIKSFEQGLPSAPNISQHDHTAAIDAITAAIGDTKTIWFLSSDPAYAVHAATIASYIKHGRHLQINLISVRAARWSIVSGASFYDTFNNVFLVRRQGYTARPGRIPALLANILEIRKLPIGSEDVVISFAHAQFAENCILSWWPKTKKILMMESRWYHFNYENEWQSLSLDGFRILRGVRFYNSVVEPLFGLYKSIYREYGDGKGVNILRYTEPLENVYDRIFLLVPPSHEQ